jgi:hypothetical protein
MVENKVTVRECEATRDGLLRAISDVDKKVDKLILNDLAHLDGKIDKKFDKLNTSIEKNSEAIIGLKMTFFKITTILTVGYAIINILLQLWINGVFK